MTARQDLDDFAGGINQFDNADDDLSSVSHGLAAKLIPATTNVRASMMKRASMAVDSDDDDDFYDAMD